MVDSYSITPTIFTLESGTTHYSRVYVDATLATTVSGVDELGVDMTLDTLESDLITFSGSLILNDLSISSTSNEVEFTESNHSPDDWDLYLEFEIDPYRDYYNVTDINYSSARADKDVYLDSLNELHLYINYLYNIDTTEVDLLIAKDKYFYMNSSMWSTLSGVAGTLSLDVTTESGRITLIPTDYYCSDRIIRSMNFDCYSTVSGLMPFDIDLATASGTIFPLDTDIYSTASGVGAAVQCDVRVWSLGLRSFFLDVEDYTTASATAWVDIYDPNYNITTSGCYFKVDGVQKAVTFSGAGNSYRMYYNPDDDFYTDGITVYTAHVENSMGDVLEKNYSLLYGYNLDYNEVVDWGPNRTVSIWTTATNKAFCPNTATDAFYFITRDYEFRSLNSIIKPVAPVDIGAALYPQNTFFFYGRTYRVTISGVKDFSGNVLEPFVYEFTIENPNN